MRVRPIDNPDTQANRLIAESFDVIELEDAEIYWNEHFLDAREADDMFEALRLETEWIQPEIRMGGRKIFSPRLAAWHGDRDAVYTYSGLTNVPRPWTPTLIELRDRISRACGTAFNSVLLNFYRDGSDSMGWHQDNERELGFQPVIASISLGGARRFVMKHKKKPQCRWEIHLTHGSALVMAGDSQHHWRHALPKISKKVGSRINLTFRKIIPDHIQGIP